MSSSKFGIEIHLARTFYFFTDVKLTKTARALERNRTQGSCYLLYSLIIVG